MSGSATSSPGTFAENSTLQKNLEAETDANNTFAKELADVKEQLQRFRRKESTMRQATLAGRGAPRHPHAPRRAAGASRRKPAVC